MRNIKLVVLPTLVILGLLMTGFAYACWSQTLYIEGSVASGELDWEIKGPINCMDELGENDWNADCSWNFWQVDKDVGGPTVLRLADTDGDGDNDTLYVKLQNAYPGYAEEISFYVHNNGTIPLVFEKVIIDNQEISDGGTIFLDLTGEGDNDIKIRWGDSVGDQFEPCISKEVSFSILVLQDAPQGATLSFTIKLVAVQWNEYVPSLPPWKPPLPPK